jgi:hypothetical protein
LTDEVITSALRYRVQAPLVDSLLADIGIEGGGLARQGGLIREAADMQRIANEARREAARAGEGGGTSDTPSGSTSPGRASGPRPKKPE